MTPDAVSPPLRSQPSVRGYTILSLTGLMGMILALMENDRDLLWILLLAAIAAVCVVAHWRIGPPLLLVGLAVLEVAYRRPLQPWYPRSALWEESSFMDAVLCASVLAYAAGHSRLVSLTRSIFPTDFRRPPAPDRPRDERRRQSFDGQLRRSAHLPGPWEMPMLAIAAAVWAVGISLFWFLISDLDPPLQMREGLWRALLLIFLVGLTMAVLAGATAYLTWITAPPEEHLLYLQDQVWRERREQNRINRWLQWARLRGQRRKERS